MGQKGVDPPFVLNFLILTMGQHPNVNHITTQCCFKQYKFKRPWETNTDLFLCSGLPKVNILDKIKIVYISLFLYFSETYYKNLLIKMASN